MGRLTIRVLAVASLLLLAVPEALSVPAADARKLTTRKVVVSATAEGTGSAEGRARAVEQAVPELEAFLARYLNAAFRPRQDERAPDLERFFHPALHDAVTRDLASLSLGDEPQVIAVRLDPARADATLLLEGVRPVAATVMLHVTGTARVPVGPVDLGLRGRLQLLRDPGGWKILSYETRARGPA